MPTINSVSTWDQRKSKWKNKVKLEDTVQKLKNVMMLLEEPNDPYKH